MVNHSFASVDILVLTLCAGIADCLAIIYWFRLSCIGHTIRLSNRIALRQKNNSS